MKNILRVCFVLLCAYQANASLKSIVTGGGSDRDRDYCNEQKIIALANADLLISQLNGGIEKYQTQINEKEKASRILTEFNTSLVQSDEQVGLLMTEIEAYEREVGKIDVVLESLTTLLEQKKSNKYTLSAWENVFNVEQYFGNEHEARISRNFLTQLKIIQVSKEDQLIQDMIGVLGGPKIYSAQRVKKIWMAHHLLVYDKLQDNKAKISQNQLDIDTLKKQIELNQRDISIHARNRQIANDKGC